jgi:hypothetical protein
MEVEGLCINSAEEGVEELRMTEREAALPRASSSSLSSTKPFLPVLSASRRALRVENIMSLNLQWQQRFPPVVG